MRVAKCGHEVPSHPGRQRRKCELCHPGQSWNYSAGKVRLALCGHEAPFSPGPVRRLCTACATPQPRACPACGSDMSHRRADAVYCSRRCCDITRGLIRAVALPPRQCALPECAVVFVPKAEVTRCCSERHGKILWNRESRADGRQVASPWDDRKRDASQRRRALKKGAATGGPVRLAEIAARDRNMCHLCGRKVPDVAYPDPLSPSLDHVVPLTRGGAHDPANVRLSHLRCNIAKGNRGGGEQLLLVG